MTCGVYLLFKGGEVVYVGQSRNTEKRLAEHRRAKVDFDAFQVIETAQDVLKKTEQQYIKLHQPKLNGRATKYGTQVFFDSSGQARSPAERQAELRTRMRAAGYKPFEVWVYPEHSEVVKRLVRWVMFKRSKDPNYKMREPRPSSGL